MEDKITIEQLLLNEAVELNIPSVGIFKIREPTRGDNLKSRTEASKISNWNTMTQDEKNEEAVLHLIPMIIVEPKITYEDLNKLSQSKIASLVDVISGFIYNRIKKLSDERQELMTNFLQVKKEKNP